MPTAGCSADSVACIAESPRRVMHVSVQLQAFGRLEDLQLIGSVFSGQKFELWRAGEQRPGTRKPLKYNQLSCSLGLWQRAAVYARPTPKPIPGDEREQIMQVISTLRSLAPVLANVDGKQTAVRIRIGVDFGGGPANFTLPRELVRALAACKLDVELSMYASSSSGARDEEDRYD
jgi:hypothetical protein